MKISIKLSISYKRSKQTKPNKQELEKQKRLRLYITVKAEENVSGVACAVKLDTLGSNLELQPVARVHRPHLHALLPAARSGSEHNSIYNQKLVPGLNLTQGVYTNTAAGGITVTV